MNSYVSNLLFCVVGFFLPLLIICGQLSCIYDTVRDGGVCLYADNSVVLYGVVTCFVGICGNPRVFYLKKLAVKDVLTLILMLLTIASGFKNLAGLDGVSYHRFLNLATSIVNFAYVVITWGSHLDEKMKSP